MRTSTRRGSSRFAAFGLIMMLAAACGGGGAEGDAAAPTEGETAAAAAGSEAADATSADLGTLSVGLICGGLSPMTAQIAINADTFPEGLEIEKVCFDGGSEAVQALIGGSLDVFMGSVEHVVSTRAQGLPTQAYAVINNRMPYWLVTPEDSEYQSVADLAGQTVGVTSTGSLSDTELQVAADQEGIAYEDMTVVSAGSGATMTAALESDSVAAGMITDPGLSEVTAEGGGYRVIWEPDFDYTSIVALANSERIGEREDAMRAFIEGLQSAYEQSQADPQFAIEAMQEEGFEVSDEALTEAVERGLTEIPEGLQIEEAAYQETVELLVGVGRIEEAEAPAFDEAFDFELLEASS